MRLVTQVLFGFYAGASDTVPATRTFSGTHVYRALTFFPGAGGGAAVPDGDVTAILDAVITLAARVTFRRAAPSFPSGGGAVYLFPLRRRARVRLELVVFLEARVRFRSAPPPPRREPTRRRMRVDVLGAAPQLALGARVRYYNRSRDDADVVVLLMGASSC